MHSTLLSIVNAVTILFSFILLFVNAICLTSDRVWIQVIMISVIDKLASKWLLKLFMHSSKSSFRCVIVLFVIFVIQLNLGNFIYWFIYCLFIPTCIFLTEALDEECIEWLYCFTVCCHRSTVGVTKFFLYLYALLS